MAVAFYLDNNRVSPQWTTFATCFDAYGRSVRFLAKLCSNSKLTFLGPIFLTGPLKRRLGKTRSMSNINQESKMPTKRSPKVRSKRTPRKSSADSAQLRSVSNALLRQFGVMPDDLKSVSSFLAKSNRIEVSRRVIQDSIIKAIEDPDARFALAVAESETLLKGYATLDDPHRLEIQKLIKCITDYLRDTTRKRPFNALMLAAPGAGKSHFIKQLANTMRDDRVQAVTFNMATMQSADDMAQPIDELRNLKVNDRFPLLFLDEFDSDPTRYAALLPLLWDGELQVGHRDLKLGKAVIVLAGSNPDLPKAMDESGKMRLETEEGIVGAQSGKLIDLLSRINGGVINIPDLDLRTEHRDRRVDKVCIAVSLMKARFGEDLSEVPRSLLRFIAETKFRYGVRSIAHLIDLIESNSYETKLLKAGALGLPLDSEAALQESSLKLHLLDKDQAFGIVNRWKEFSKDKIQVKLIASSPLFYISNLNFPIVAA